MDYKQNITGQNIPIMKYTDDPYEEMLLYRPIGRYGRLWQEWMTNNHSGIKAMYIVNCTWAIIPREIDIKANIKWLEFTDEYVENNPRPNDSDFMTLAKWEKSKQLYAEHKVLEEIVYQEYEPDKNLMSLGLMPKNYKEYLANEKE